MNENDKITATGKKFTCSECQNEVELADGKKVGDVIECPFCGIEFEIAAMEGDNSTLQMIEEEK